MSEVVLVVGMSRSGTTLAAEMLAFHPHVHVEVEPHMLWKSGNFCYLADDRYDIEGRAVGWIREQLLRSAGDAVLVDKSPPNCLRSGLVHAVFPEARVIYLERDPVRCVYSNYRKSLAGVSLNPKVVAAKYLRPSRARARVAQMNQSGLGQHLDAHASRSVFRQVRTGEIPAFLRYAVRLLRLRVIDHCLPFGPKITGFADIVAREGVLGYHARAVTAAARERATFEEIYGNRFNRFKLEALVREPREVERLFAAAGLDPTPSMLEHISRQLDPRLIEGFRPPRDMERQIAGALAIAGHPEI